MTASLSAAPESDLDPFSLEFLVEPYAAHRELRELGPVVRLTRYRVWAMARHHEVSAALQDHAIFCSSRGGGLTDFAKEKPWRPPSIILEADPPLHTQTRAVLSKVLSRPALMALKATMEEHAEALLDQALTAERIDGVSQLAQAFPLSVFPDAVGLPREGREHLLPYGDMAFNAFGPRNELLDASMRKAADVIPWITAQCRREALSAHGFGAQIYAEADAGAITPDQAALLVRSLLTAGLDTTIHGIAHALHCFAEHPHQWRAVRDDPTLVRNAFEEVIRYVSPVQTFFRTTTRAAHVSGFTLPEGEKVLLFLAAANRDPRRWEQPDVFDVRRPSAGHVGFGYGIHQCVGQMVARMEAETLLSALSRRVAAFHLDGPPTLRLNNTLRGLEALPLRIELLRERRAASVRASWLELRVVRKRAEAQGVFSFELADPEARELPPFSPGSHLDVEIRPGLTRQYSLCNDSLERRRYVIAVLRERASRGGSRLAGAAR
jgi:cytochrome P450